MKKQFLFLFFLFLSTLSFAQSSLDSLRLVLPVGHTDYINTIAYSPNGKYILSSSHDKSAILWDTKTGKILNRFSCQIKGCIGGAFSPDNKKILTISGNQIKIWKINNNELISEFNIESREFGAPSANFSNTGNQVIIVDRFVTSNILIYSIDKGIITNSYIDVDGFCFNSDHTLLAISDDSIVKLLNIKKDEIIWSVFQKDRVNDISFSLNDKYILTECLSSSRLRLWNALNGNLIKEIKLKEGYYGERFRFNPNCKNFVSVNKHEIIFWNIQTGKRIRSYKSSNFDLFIKSFSEDGNYLIAYSKDSSIIVLDGTTGKFIYKLSSIGSDGSTVSSFPTVIINSAKDLLVLKDENNNVKSWRLSTGEFLNKIVSNEVDIGTLIINSSLMQFATLTATSDYFIDYSLRIWDARNGKLLYCLKDRTKEINSLSLDSNNQNLLISHENSAHLLDIATLNRILSLEHSSSEYSEMFQVQNVIYNSNKTLILSKLEPLFLWAANWDSCIHIWNPRNGNLLYTLKGHLNSISTVKFSPDGLNILTASSDTTIRIWSSADGELISSFKLHNNKVRSAEYNKDGTLILSSSNDEVFLIDAKTGNLVRQIISNSFNSSPAINGLNIGKYVYKAMFSPDYKQILILSNWIDVDNNMNETDINSIDVYDSSANFLFSIDHRINGFINAKYSPDGKKFLMEKKGSNKVYVYDARSGSILYELFGHDGNFEFGEFNTLGDKIVTGGMDGKVMIWEASSGRNLMVLSGHEKTVTKAAFSKNDQFLFSIGDDNKLILWDLRIRKPIYELFNLEQNNYLVKLPNSPYYMCSKDASKMLHYVTPSLKVIGFEQLDPVYNRPDIVLDSIGKYFGNSDGGMIDEYRKSWEKRIDRLGLDKEMLGKGEIAVPNAEIVNADTKTDKAPMIEYTNSSGKTIIHVKAIDSKYKLKRYNVYVNEVPVYGSLGRSITHLNTSSWEGLDTITLSQGENKIQVSVMNELGLENFKYPTYVNYTPEKEIVAKTHYIGIGVNEFKEPGHKLNYCVKDVQDLAKAFATENKNIDTLLFTDQQVTKENILALKDYLNKTSVNDKVIISCSSHGLLDDSLNFYLAMHDVDFNNPKARGLKYEELESLLDGIPARQKLLLLDACNSGENDKTEALKQELQQKEKSMDNTQILTARSIIIKLEEENKSNFKKMNELFVNVRNNTGSVIISAAGGQESALEGDLGGLNIKNGAFTYSILEYLDKYKNDKNELTVNKLKQYVEKRVEEITNGRQKPTSRQETMEVDWGVK